MTLLQILPPNIFAVAKGISAMRNPEITAHSIYNSIAKSNVNTVLLVFANVIATIIVVKKILHLMTEFVEKADGDMLSKIKFIWKSYKVYFLILIVGALFPVLLGFLENILTTAAGKVNIVIGGNSPLDQLSQEQLSWVSKHDSMYWTAKLDIDYITDYIMIYWIKPLLVAFDQFVYFMYAMIREFYLILLEIVAPIAFVCLLDKDYHTYFFTWLRHLIACFLMLPAFLIANYMSITATSIVFTDDGYTLLAIVCGLLLKWRLLSASKKYVTQLI
jgi:hypothetical protein